MSKLEKLKKAIELVNDPSCNLPIGETQGISHIGYDENKDQAVIIIGMYETGGENERTLRKDIAKVVKLDNGIASLKLEVELLKKKDSILSEKHKVKYIGVASGKGGVGKSTVAANLAVALTRAGKKIGVIDADIHGSNIPVIMGLPHRTPYADENKKIIPFVQGGIQVISTEFFMEKDKPLMWRGSLLGKMLNHFFYDVKWDDELDYIIVDLPPGTGDIAMDIQMLIPQAEMIIVTTPHPSASHVAVKAGYGAKQLKHNLIGVIENMSYFINPINNQKEHIFGQGGGKTVAEKLETELIAQIPLGQPANGHHSIYPEDDQIGRIYQDLASKIIKKA